MSELLPCPFCGGSKVTYVIDNANDTNWYSIACESCGANAALDLRKSGAIDKWNTRARSSIEDERANIAALRASAAEVDALRAELDTLRNDHVVLMNDRNVTQAENDELRATVTEQAQTIETARELIERQANGSYATFSDRVDALRAWLAANAPTPTPTQGETESEK